MRAVVVKQDAAVASGGGQRTARPTNAGLQRRSNVIVGARPSGRFNIRKPDIGEDGGRWEGLAGEAA